MAPLLLIVREKENTTKILLIKDFVRKMLVEEKCSLSTDLHNDYNYRLFFLYLRKNLIVNFFYFIIL